MKTVSQKEVNMMLHWQLEDVPKLEREDDDGGYHPSTLRVRE
jgi:hypothetical protein